MYNRKSSEVIKSDNMIQEKAKSMCLALQICKIKVALEYAIIDLKPPNVSKNYTVVKA